MPGVPGDGPVPDSNTWCLPAPWFRFRIAEYEDRFLSPFIAAERGYIDDVIMPHSTRRRIARALAMLRDKKVEMPAKKHDNLPL